MRTRAGNRSDTYFELIKKFPLESIRDVKHLEQAHLVLEDLLVKESLDFGEEMYFDALTDLVELYEANNIDFPDVSGAEMLAFLISSKNVTQADVIKSTGISKSTISAILSGRRPISMSHLEPLASYFGVSPAVFLPKVRN